MLERASRQAVQCRRAQVAAVLLRLKVPSERGKFCNCRLSVPRDPLRYGRKILNRHFCRKLELYLWVENDGTCWVSGGLLVISFTDFRDGRETNAGGMKETLLSKKAVFQSGQLKVTEHHPVRRSEVPITKETT